MIEVGEKLVFDHFRTIFLLKYMCGAKVPPDMIASPPRGKNGLSNVRSLMGSSSIDVLKNI